MKGSQGQTEVGQTQQKREAKAATAGLGFAAGPKGGQEQRALDSGSSVEGGQK